MKHPLTARAQAEGIETSLRVIEERIETLRAEQTRLLIFRDRINEGQAAFLAQFTESSDHPSYRTGKDVFNAQYTELGTLRDRVHHEITALMLAAESIRVVAAMSSALDLLDRPMFRG